MRVWGLTAAVPLSAMPVAQLREESTGHAIRCLTCVLQLLQGSAEVPDGQYLPEPSETEDRRTPAERRYDEMMAKRAAEKTKKMAMKSHRWAVLVSYVSVTKVTAHH